MTTFTGFSEEDLKRIKSGGESTSNNDNHTTYTKKTTKFIPAKKKAYQYKINVQNQKIDDAIDDLQFDKCRLSIKPPIDETVTKPENNEGNDVENIITIEYNDKENKIVNNNQNSEEKLDEVHIKDVNTTPDIVRGVDFVEDDSSSHRAKLGELQLKQRLMEEQNKKRKEMLSRALADRTRQTTEEVMKLEKIKKELQVLDGQFSQDVAVLRKKIDVACLTYSEAEKHYLKVEKEFLQAKIQLQKEKEKKELLTEHLCALITHNETRKAQKLETLMLELASHRNVEETAAEPQAVDDNDDSSVIIDGVDQKTGKMVELNGNS